jgi:NADH-quinone oxidoreductase subunit M
LIPLVTGLLCFFAGKATVVKSLALVGSLAALAVMLYAISLPANSNLVHYSRIWLGTLNSNLSLGLDGAGKITCLLTVVSFPLIFLATWNNVYKNSNQFYGLMLLTMAGLLGVFLATDCLLFYFFWELALIPVYFLCSIWGAERRIAATFKFFIYTFVGSLLMLVGLIYLQSLTPDKSFDINSFYQIAQNGKGENWVFWLIFVAFAIKIPVFPFHSWQPDTYEQ